MPSARLLHVALKSVGPVCETTQLPLCGDSVAPGSTPSPSAALVVMSNTSSPSAPAQTFLVGGLETVTVNTSSVTLPAAVLLAAQPGLTDCAVTLSV